MSQEAWDPVCAGEIVALHAGREGAALPILHALQDRFGYIHRDAVPIIAEALNLSRAEIVGVVSFYHDFRQKPAGRHVVKLCRAEACQSVGAVTLAEHARKHLGIDWHETTPDGRITLEPAFCLGLCARGPAALVDGEPVCLLDPAGFEQRLAELPA